LPQKEEPLDVRTLEFVSIILLRDHSNHNIRQHFRLGNTVKIIA